MKALTALCVGLALTTFSASLARLALPPIPHYAIEPLPLPKPPAPPRYTEHYDQGDSKRNAEDNKNDYGKSRWQRITDDPVAFVTLCLVAVAGVQAGLFVWQLILIGKSLGDTKIAAEAARDTAIALQSSLNIARHHADATSDAAKAAGDSARIAERALTDVERALVLAVRFDVNQIVRANRAIGYRVTVIFVNSGRTPALRLRGNFNLVVFPGEPVPDFAYPDRAAPDEAFGTTGPQVPVLFHLEIVTEDLVDVRESRKVALIYGWVEYDDVFSGSRRRRTEACLRIEVVGDIHRIRPADEPIGATPSVLAFANYGGRYNAIDEYCLYEPGQTPVDDGSLPVPRQPPPISEDAV